MKETGAGGRERAGREGFQGKAVSQRRRKMRLSRSLCKDGIVNRGWVMAGTGQGVGG